MAHVGRRGTLPDEYVVLKRVTAKFKGSKSGIKIIFDIN